MPRIIVISGPPGAGKSTLSKLLAEKLPGPVALVSGDAFWTFIAKTARDSGPSTTDPAEPPAVGGTPRFPDFRAIMKAMSHTAGSMASDGYNVILDLQSRPALRTTVCSE